MTSLGEKMANQARIDEAVAFSRFVVEEAEARPCACGAQVRPASGPDAEPFDPDDREDAGWDDPFVRYERERMERRGWGR